MTVKTYRARTLHDALRMVRTELGPDASVLQTRQVRGLRGWLGRYQVEVTASAGQLVPSRLSPSPLASPVPLSDSDLPASTPSTDAQSFRDRCRAQIHQTSSLDLESFVEKSDPPSTHTSDHAFSPSAFHLFAELLDAELSEELARDLVARVATGGEVADPMTAKAHIARLLESEISVTGPFPINLGRCRRVALVGPTGVGKTTTIAKLAANYRLREKRRVGLITVDTYRIAAVDQLRTYADIIDLPMEVVSTPKEMREAVARFADLDLVFIDTAGRSPRDEVRIQELKSLMTEADACDICLVLSSVAGSTSLVKTARRFSEVGVTSLLLTKLDEAGSLGNVLPLLRDSKLPVCYVTNGQNVPQDIAAAEPRLLARAILNSEDH